MKFIIFGSLAGTELSPGRNHTALALEKEGKLYLFDAGENCSRTMRFMGYAPACVAGIFISGFREGRCGGMPELLECLSAEKRHFPVYTPEGGIFPLWEKLLERTGTLPREGSFEEHLLEGEGSLELDALKISWCRSGSSLAFRIDAEGKKIIYAPDGGNMELPGEWLHNADLLLAAPGELDAPGICRKLKHQKRRIGKLVFLQKGSETPEASETNRSRARDIRNEGLFFAEDGQIFEL